MATDTNTTTPVLEEDDQAQFDQLAATGADLLEQFQHIAEPVGDLLASIARLGNQVDNLSGEAQNRRELAGAEVDELDAIGGLILDRSRWSELYGALEDVGIEADELRRLADPENYTEEPLEQFLDRHDGASIDDRVKSLEGQVDDLTRLLEFAGVLFGQAAKRGKP
jgi:hypothetical protein